MSDLAQIFRNAAPMSTDGFTKKSRGIACLRTGGGAEKGAKIKVCPILLKFSGKLPLSPGMALVKVQGRRASLDLDRGKKG